MTTPWEANEDRLQAWADECARKAGIVQWIPVMVIRDIDGATDLAAAEVCPEHDVSRGTDVPAPERCDDCAIYVDMYIFDLPESVQYAIIAHEIAHFALGYSKTWNYLDDTQDLWMLLRRVSVPALLLCSLQLHRLLPSRYQIDPKVMTAAGVALTGLSAFAAWCTWRHASENQRVEMQADAMSVNQFGVVPDKEWEVVLSEGELLRQKIPVLSSFISHPSAKRRIEYVRRSLVR